MANSTRIKEMATRRKDALTILANANLSADAAKMILKMIIENENEFDLRLQEIEREIGVSDSFVSSSDIPTRIG